MDKIRGWTAAVTMTAALSALAGCGGATGGNGGTRDTGSNDSGNASVAVPPPSGCSIQTGSTVTVNGVRYTLGGDIPQSADDAPCNALIFAEAVPPTQEHGGSLDVIVAASYTLQLDWFIPFDGMPRETATLPAEQVDLFLFPTGTAACAATNVPIHLHPLPDNLGVMEGDFFISADSWASGAPSGACKDLAVTFSIRRVD